ncbi:hypothetical protein B0G62_11283 [Paraburkholderia eburnea]|uniref:Uncharacterized protein n=1 Tax=Paraburkholderia eburnea TaxID=1189126 RepID=A0A2S4M3D2_9BURK|nr:hypothetical protein [Paraburkholderia eburnea]POR49099.1 hypothetical protein B0G62_11283 [Paraburkholderia eburnea]PRZ19476.1 hypothetical protein BX588_11583 [Paraburkholderia eburnea]
MASDRFFRPSLAVVLTAAAVALASAGAHAAGKPLILDTERGINDGQSGTVLQNAPLSHQPMVQMKSLPTLNGNGTDGSQPIIVAPYVEVPGGGGRPPRPRTTQQHAPQQYVPQQ